MDYKNDFTHFLIHYLIMNPPNENPLYFYNLQITKKPSSLDEGFLRIWNKFRIKKGDDILSHITAVPSAQAGLTTLFGMGRGEPRRNNHLKGFVSGLRLLLFKVLQP